MGRSQAPRPRPVGESEPMPDPASVLTACEEAIAQMYLRLPGFDALLAEDVTLASVGVPVPWLNQASGARFTAETADARIDEVIAWYDAHGVPFAWELGPRDQPADLDARLFAHGLVVDDDAHSGMAASLLSGLPPLDLPTGVTFQIVRDPDAFHDWMDVFAAGFEMPPDVISAFSKFALLGFGDELPYRVVLARIADRPVATALGFLAGGGAVILNVATIPEFRRRGLGRAVTLAAMHTCAEFGASVAVLQSSEMGCELYRRLGFEEFGRYRSFVRVMA